MILGINAVQSPIDYGVYSKPHSVKISWDGFGAIEDLPKRLADFLVDFPKLSGLFTVLGPGNYTGIRLALTTIKMISKVHCIPWLGMSLFDAYLRVNPTEDLTLLTSASRKGWLNMQLFQSSNGEPIPISSINQIQVASIDGWISQFQAPIFWGHFGLDEFNFNHKPRRISLDILSVASFFESEILSVTQTSSVAPIYSYPAVQ
ncbi:MAG: hypothetical protein VW397_02830 [Candidatus Margulisiibacteriota bacterium]